ncbi:hypothetical protein NUH87_05860 [Pseudomonas batumici]|uniref:hypothetical protein n=1 Tax=Pseudomonas batumici TaxID=226910 RepID=UPI0030CD893F
MKFIVFVLVIFTSTFVCAEPLFPQHESCTAGKDKASGCGVILDEGGFLVDGSTGDKISIVSENTGMMSSNWLYRYSGKYVLEHLDFTSSKARQWVVFSYIDKKIIIDRVYSFSQEISAQSVPAWYGYECRGSGGELVNDKNLAFSESVIATICGDAVNGSLRLKKEAFPSMGVTLAISIPVYSSKKIAGAATYLFFDTNKPEVFQMACYFNCALQSQDRKKIYVGRISSSAWFVSQVNENGCQSSGGYKYKKSQEQIVFSGCVEKDAMNLVEYLPGTNSERAQFSGKADGEGYKGEWVSKSGDNKRFGFFMYPLTVY